MTRRLQMLFLAAMVGVLIALGLLAVELGGMTALAAYSLVAVALFAGGAARARRTTRHAAAHSCDCCSRNGSGEVTVR